MYTQLTHCCEANHNYVIPAHIVKTLRNLPEESRDVITGAVMEQLMLGKTVNYTLDPIEALAAAMILDSIRRATVRSASAV